MKGILNRVLILGLALLLSVGLCVFAVNAQQVESAQIEPVIWIDSCYQENPLVQADLPDEPAVYYTDFEEFLREARRLAVARVSSFQLGYKTTENCNSTIGRDALDGCFAHTGNPKEGDYLRWNTGSIGVGGSVSQKGDEYYYDLTYTISYYTTAEQEREVDEAVASLLSSLHVTNTSPYYKAKAVYDYMCENIVYDYDGLRVDDVACHTTYSAIINHKTVCQGYSSLFYRMMLEMGVPCRVIAGDASAGATPNNTSDDHGWNIVKMGKLYYNLDATWDAQAHPDCQNYEYFLRGKDNFPKHTPWEKYTTEAFCKQHPLSDADYTYVEVDLTPHWYQTDGNWYYSKDGLDVTGWEKIDNKWYYFDSAAVMQTGWLQDGGKWYYLRPSGAMATGWVQDGGKWYFMDAFGVMVANQWRKDSKGWCWLTASGAMATNAWVKDSKGWCYIGADGYCLTNCWAKDSTGWIWLDKEGSMTKNQWIQDGGNWYYLNSSGYMATSWQKVSNNWYYLGTNGAMTTGWQKVGNSWYYLGTNGAMTTGWVKLGNNWYYLQSNGVMATGSLKIGTKTYNFNASGVCLNP